MEKLKLIAGMVVIESKMSKAGKIKMLKFIKNEATSTQIKGFLLDGKFYKINKKIEKDINERFDVKKITERTRKYISSKVKK